MKVQRFGKGVSEVKISRKKESKAISGWYVICDRKEQLCRLEGFHRCGTSKPSKDASKGLPSKGAFTKHSIGQLTLGGWKPLLSKGEHPFDFGVM